jgi:hypothetical protein
MIPADQRQASSRSGDPHHGRFVPLRPASAHRRARSLAALAALQSASAGRGSQAEAREPDEIDWLVQWRAVLECDATMPSEVRAIELAWSLRHILVRDAVLLQCGWGFDTGLLAVREAFGSTVSAESPGVLARLAGETREAPAAASLRRAVVVLRHVVECSPPQLTAVPLTMLGWLEWARGRGTIAAAYLDEALRIDPDHPLAGAFSPLVNQGHIPTWLA